MLVFKQFITFFKACFSIITSLTTMLFASIFSFNFVLFTSSVLPPNGFSENYAKRAVPLNWPLLIICFGPKAIVSSFLGSDTGVKSLIQLKNVSDLTTVPDKDLHLLREPIWVSWNAKVIKFETFSATVPPQDVVPLAKPRVSERHSGQAFRNWKMSQVRPLHHPNTHSIKTWDIFS